MPSNDVARILIVDDETHNQQALQRLLMDENPGWKVLVADNEMAGIDVMKRQLKDGEPIDVVITDLVMGEPQGGMTMLSEARKIDPLVMAILFTAKEKNLDRYAAFDIGAFDVVEKNIRGVAAAKEINVKARAALRYRAWSLRISVLRRYFDPAVFERVEQDPSALQLRSATVTIVFWDIRGFSSLCETLRANPVLISDFLREYCDCAAKCIFRCNGVLDKFIGDGVMALFGAMVPSPDEGDCAVNAVNAAMEFRVEFETLVAKWMKRWELYTPQTISIGLGCGIHTGDVLVGNVGTDFRDQFTALGPHVNFASRIEARAKAGEILLSQSTEGRVKGRHRTNPAGEIADIKNIPGVFKIFSVP